MTDEQKRELLEWLDDVKAADQEAIYRAFIGNREHTAKMQEIKRSKRNFQALRRIVEAVGETQKALLDAQADHMIGNLSTLRYSSIVEEIAVEFRDFDPFEGGK